VELGRFGGDKLVEEVGVAKAIPVSASTRKELEAIVLVVLVEPTRLQSLNLRDE
jgi:hypothetical protein